MLNVFILSKIGFVACGECDGLILDNETNHNHLRVPYFPLAEGKKEDWFPWILSMELN